VSQWKSKEHEKIPQKWTLALDLSRSMILWGIRWFPLVEKFNSHHWSKPCKRNESKRAKNDESKEKLEGKVKSSQRTCQEHMNWFKLRTLEDTRWLGPPFPQRFMVLTLIAKKCVDVRCGPNHTPERALNVRAATDRRTQQDITLLWWSTERFTSKPPKDNQSRLRDEEPASF
jgi:hypothetical protein